MLKKALSIFLKLSLGLVAVIVVCVVLIFTLVDPNDYKEDIELAVESATGRTLDIPGKLELSLFPWLGVSIGEVALGNAPGFGEQAFARVEKVEVHVNVMPLIDQQVEVGVLRLHGLNLALKVNEDGSNNWSSLAGQEASAAEEESEQPSTSSASTQEAPAIAALAIGGIEIVNANVSYDDRQAGTRHELQALNLKTGAISLTTPFDLEGDFSVAVSEPAMKADIQFASNIQFDLEAQRYDFNDFVLNVSALGEGLPVQPLDVAIGANVGVDLVKQEFALDRFSLNVLELAFSGEIKGEKIVDAPAFSGHLALAPFNGRDLIARLAEPLETADPAALSKVSLGLDFLATTERAEVKSLTVRIDESTLTGGLAVNNFVSTPLRFDFTLDEMDVDRYLPPPVDEEEGVDIAPTPEPAVEDEVVLALPVELLRELDVQGSFKAGQLKASQVELSNLELGLKMEKGVIDLAPLAMNLYEGTLTGQAGLDVRQDTPKITFASDLKTVQINPLMVNLADLDLISGRTDLNVNVRTEGVTVKDLTHALNGSAAFLFRDGAVKGINIAKTIRDAWAKIKGRPVVEGDEPQQTDFSELKGSFKIVNGVVHNKDLEANAPLLRVRGEGRVDLNKEKLNYLVKTKIVGTLHGQGGKSLSDLKGLTVPIRIKGPFTDPKIRPELDRALKEKAKQKLDKEKARVQERLDKEKARAREKVEQEKARAREKLEQEKARAREKLNQEKEKLELELKEKTEDKLKELFKF